MEQLQLSPTPEALPGNLEVVQHAVDTLAGEFHNQWRQTRLDAQGNFEPRVKPTSDQEWSSAHGGATEVDIANTEYADLPEDWKAENKAAADVVVGLMLDRDGKVDLEDPDTKNEVGGIVHDAWLSRNEWAKGGDLDVPFEQLPPDEQAKDIDQVITAQRVFEV